MKNTLLSLLGFVLLSTPLPATAQQSGDFYYTSDGSAVTITGYNGPGGAVIIPDTIIGLPVRTIGDQAFQWCSLLTSVTIPGSVTGIGSGAFIGCSSLNNVTIPHSVNRIGDAAFSSCTSLTNVTIPGSVTSVGSGAGAGAFSYCTHLTRVAILDGVSSIGGGAFYFCTDLTSIAIPNSVTNIGNQAFGSCTNLPSVTIAASLNYIGDYAFYNCTSLQRLFFKGNAANLGLNPFFGNSTAIIYYLPGTTGWGATFAGRPTRLWNPLMQSSGVGPAGFGFNISGTTNIPIVIEAATNLANAAWVPLQSLNLTNGAFYFSDSNWTNYQARFYRIRSP